MFLGCVISGLLKPHLQVNITGREGSTRSGGPWALQFPTWGGVRSGGITIVLSLVDASGLILIDPRSFHDMDYEVSF